MEKIGNFESPFAIYLEKAKNRPLVSVIITTKNEEKNIENSLKSIMNQSYKNIELIIVDDLSKDQTVETAKKYDAKIYFKASERSAGRNYGAKLALGEYLLYLDADMILSPTVIEECVTKCDIESVDALYVPEHIIGDGFWIKVRDFERSFYTRTVIDAVRFIRRNLFLQVKGFDETLVGGEDWDFDRKIRKFGKIGLIKAPLFHNEGVFNLEKYLGKKSYYGPGLRKYIQKWGSNDEEVIKQVGVGYRLIGVFVENGKWKNLVKHPLYTIAMYTLRLRVAFSYLKSYR